MLTKEEKQAIYDLILSTDTYSQELGFMQDESLNNGQILKGLESRYSKILTKTNMDIEELLTSKVLDLGNSNIGGHLDLRGLINLQEVSCHHSNLVSIDISENVNLTRLYANHNKLSKINTSNNLKLEILTCSINNISKLDVSKNNLLTRLECGQNKFTSIDISKNTKLKEFSCQFANITNIDISNNTELSNVYLNDTNIKSLDTSKNTKLTWFTIPKSTKLIGSTHIKHIIKTPSLNSQQ